MLKKLFLLINLMSPVTLSAHDFKGFHFHTENILFISFLILTIVVTFAIMKSNYGKNY